MKVSLNTIKQYTEIDLPVDELVSKINQQLGGVEEVIDLGARYKDAVIVKIVSAVQHPNADRLQVTTIDDGGVRQDVERDENGFVQVVCGAPNAREGIFAIWLPPKSIVPASFEEKQPFVLGARELRGVMSHGMLAAADELAIGSDHEGIIEINLDEWKPGDVKIKPGTSFAEAYGLNDTIIDIENKMFTHRPDLFGQLGVAREIAGIQHKSFDEPDWYVSPPEFKAGDGLELNTFNDAPDKVPRFMTVAIKDIEVKPSPLWLQCELVRLGAKPINNIVDATNYVMLLTAQPTHAYDYDKLRGHTLGTRRARAGESITLLNHKTYRLNEDDIVIVDGEGPVGLAGIMGGGESEVSDETKSIVLEVATFDMYTLRKSSMRHGVFTDALTRFNKGQSPLQNDRVLHLLLRSILDTAGGSQASQVSDLRDTSGIYDRQSMTDEQPIGVDFINDRLGLQLTGDEISKLLQNVHFRVHDDGDDSLRVTPPFWRTDIELPEDIVEEVGRLYGFDRLPRILPSRSIAPAASNDGRELAAAVRQNMARLGANEVLTYSFVHEKTLLKAGQDPERAFKLSNALSPDLQYYRLSLIPSLLEKVHPNIKNGYSEFVLYELGKGHNKSNIGDDGLPVETALLEAVYASKKSGQGPAFYVLRRQLLELLRSIGVEATVVPLQKKYTYAGGLEPFDADRSGMIIASDGAALGVIGELQQTVHQAFKLPDQTAAAGIDFDRLLTAEKNAKTYKPISRFPSTSQDISLKVSLNVTYDEVMKSAKNVLGELDESYESSLTPIGIYQPEGGNTKTVTFRVTLASHATTLTDADIKQVIVRISEAAIKAVNAELV